MHLMIVKHRSGWGYETLMREVSDSLHLRRFCWIGMTERVPDESTVRKLTRRLGAEVVHEITRELIQKARREKRFRPGAAADRLDRRGGGRPLADGLRPRRGRRQSARQGGTEARQTHVAEKRTAVRDRSRAMGRRLRALTRTIRRRSGEAKREVLELTEQTGQLLQASIKEARTLAATARRRARGRGARGTQGCEDLGGARRPLEKVCSQIRQRVAGEPIKDRLISLWDPDARPIRKGKLGRPTEFGYVDQLCEITANTKRGARGFILPPKTNSGTRPRTRCSPTPRPN